MNTRHSLRIQYLDQQDWAYGYCTGCGENWNSSQAGLRSGINWICDQYRRHLPSYLLHLYDIDHLLQIGQPDTTP